MASLLVRKPVLDLREGLKASHAGYPCTVLRQYSEGMWEIRHRSGVACVPAEDIRPAFEELPAGKPNIVWRQGRGYFVPTVSGKDLLGIGGRGANDLEAMFEDIENQYGKEAAMTFRSIQIK